MLQAVVGMLVMMTMLARAQVAEQVAVDMEKGLILRQQGEVNLSPGKDGSSGHATLTPADGKPIALTEFTFACELQLSSEPGGDHPQDVANVDLGDRGLFVAVSPNGGILIRGLDNGKELIGGVPVAPRTGRAIHIAVAIKPDARQALSALWLDGTECASFHTPAQKLMLQSVALGLGELRQGTLSHARLYNRALTRPEIIALANLHPAPAATHTIALIGSTEAVLMAESGWLDAYLALKSAAAPGAKRIALRNLAWEGDTVWRQDRPLNFGPLEQQLDRVQAQQVVVMLGRQECIERGEAGLADFRTALDALVAKCPSGALLMGCVPFDPKPPPQRDLSALNPVLARYDDAIKAVAEARGGTFFDTRKSWRKQEAVWTRDGVTLNARGEGLLGDVTAFALGFHGSDPDEASMTKLRTLAQAKEQLWHRYWRPSNWAFLYGDRTTQPSSRDHLNPSIRWFPQELERYRQLIDEKEAELWKQAEALGRKLP
jgi:hypothetical protein